MAYSKINWSEATPITADKLSQMDEGIANALEKSGGVTTGDLSISNGDTKQYLKIGTAETYKYLYNPQSSCYLRLMNDGRMTYNGYLVPTFTTTTATHNQIRYGSGLTGESGYITFTW